MRSATYVLDGAAAQPYTERVVVSALGQHRLTAAVVDKAGNLGTAGVSWTQQAAGPPTGGPTSPTVVVSLSGTTTAPNSYVGPVTATVAVTAAAGVRSVSYALDGAAGTPYSVPIVITSPGAHTLVATGTDDAGAVGTTTVSWTQRAAPPSVTDDFTTGGTVTPSCLVTGLDGVLANTAGNQCAASKIAFVPAGLSLTSTAGQLADDNQQNALYKSFDASGGNFTVTARVVGPVNQLTADYQQIGAWFGPDQDNFVKVEAEHNGSGAPHLTMFYRENGVAGIVGTTALPALTTAGTVDLVIRSAGDQLTVYYSIDGAGLSQVGATRSPAAKSAWFSASAKAGIEVSNSGSGTAMTGTFSRFSIAGS